MAFANRDIIAYVWRKPSGEEIHIAPGEIGIVRPDTGKTDPIGIALTAFPEDDERHWLVEAYLFNLLAHKAQTRADDIRRKRTVT